MFKTLTKLQKPSFSSSSTLSKPTTSHIYPHKSKPFYKNPTFFPLPTWYQNVQNPLEPLHSMPLLAS
jgi:hypothetical protein